MSTHGNFTISLDFELYWGMRDVQALDSYKEHIRNVHVVIPKLLELFKKYEIHATWAIVGFLYLHNKEELLHNFPEELPAYSNKQYDPYHYIKNNDLQREYHFAPGCIEMIKNTPYQEIGTHTFSHYYTLEEGQNYQQFKSDLQTAIAMQSATGQPCRSIVFPRNQYDDAHLKIIKELNINFYRGNQKFWLYKPRPFYKEYLWLRLIRLADAYINISGRNTFILGSDSQNIPVNIRASRFLRPYTQRLRRLENLRFRRIQHSMQHAARQNENYHLWWHPHNFGKNIEENLCFLEKILIEYTTLNRKFGFSSKSMCEY
ncbi:MAG: polysaccharide deacetylase family protein [Bacteroidota bacterium]|nr:polysaccharide deacetylase family protein [Bacteroidota bacterium]